VPEPRVNLTRFHGVFAPNSKHRALVTLAKRGKGNKPKAPDEGQEKTLVERRAAMTWAQRLKRVFMRYILVALMACTGRAGPHRDRLTGPPAVAHEIVYAAYTRVY